MSLLTIEHSGINARLKPTGPCDGPLISIPLVGRRSVHMPNVQMAFLPNWASWIRTNECSSQSAVPFHLAIAQFRRIFPVLFCAARKYLISPLGTFLCLPREKAICTESTALLHVSSMVSTISIAPLASYRVSHN